MKDEDVLRKKLHNKALSAPKTSGVYLWKNELGEVLYIGKAKSVKARLSSYFTSKQDIKTKHLISRASDFEYITTQNEYEALLLENTLIKEHSPKYNINLKDGKTYPVIKITNEDFPRIYRTRRIFNDGASYFGPFPNVAALDSFLDFVKKNWKLRQCKRLKKRDTPCLYYHIDRCSAPCVGKISKEKYNDQIKELLLILSGEKKALLKLNNLMKEAAKNRNFEKAARIRDGIKAIEQLTLQNTVVDMDQNSRDYIAWAKKGLMVSFAVLQMRDGKLVGRDLYRVRSLKDEGDLVLEFLMAYYTKREQVPSFVFVPNSDCLYLANKWIRKQINANTTIQAVKINIDDESNENKKAAEFLQDNKNRKHSAAMAMAYFNAKEDALRRLKEYGDYFGLDEIKKILDMKNLPSVIEGFDISHIDGKHSVASMVVFIDGVKNRKKYRRYKLKTTEGKIDDVLSIKEVATRRYTRLLNEQADLPDCIFVDGGIAQANAVNSILESLELNIPVLSLTEKKEEIYTPNNSNPIVLSKNSDALKLLQRIRDEAHRFANSYNQKLRKKEATKLRFEQLPGVGPKKAKLLLDAVGSIEGLYDLTESKNGVEKLSKLAKISLDDAMLIAAEKPPKYEKG